jgi:hypothetical protein
MLSPASTVFIYQYFTMHLMQALLSIPKQGYNGKTTY